MGNAYTSFIPHSEIELKTSKLVNSLFVWNYKTHFKWSGLEFADFREYSFWDDAKNIDFLRSSQCGKTLVKLFEEERELGVYFLCDFESTQNEKKQVLMESIYLIWFSAIKSSDKVGLCTRGSNWIDFVVAKKWRSHFVNIVNRLHSFFSCSDNWNIWKSMNMLSYFNNLKVSKNLVFLFTDRLDLDDTGMKILALKNDVVVVHIFSHFENYLDGGGVLWLKGGSVDLFIDLDDDVKKQEYIGLRREKLRLFQKKILQLGGSYIFLDEKKNVYKEFFTFMRGR
jgi:uncharacterized protein (DUF58 family)